MANKYKDSFFHRWSKRKISSEKNIDKAVFSYNDKEFKDKESDVPKELFNQENTKEESNEFAGLSDKEILKKLNLPEPETMKTGDNFKEFLKKKYLNI